MIDICCSIRDERGTYSKYIGVMMCSVLENTNKNICFHIFHDGTLSASNRNKMDSMIKKYQAKAVFYQIDFPFCRVNELAIQRYSKASLYRLLLPKLLPEKIKKVLYLDADIVFNTDINDIWQEDFDGNVLIGFPDYMLTGGETKPSFFVDNGVVSKETYVNSGVLLINLERMRREHDLLAESLLFLEKHHSEARFPDQDALNYIFKDKIKSFSRNICRASVLSRKYPEVNNRLIYHFLGDSPSDICAYEVDRLFLTYLKKSPWGTDDYIHDHYRKRLAEKEEQIRCVYSMMEILRTSQHKKIVYWGANGKISELVRSYFAWKPIDYCVDNNSKTWGKFVDRYKVCSPETLWRESLDDVIVINATFSSREIDKQLEGRGYKKNINFFNGTYLLPEKDVCLCFAKKPLQWDL